MKSPRGIANKALKRYEGVYPMWLLDKVKDQFVLECKAVEQIEKLVKSSKII